MVDTGFSPFLRSYSGPSLADMKQYSPTRRLATAQQELLITSRLPPTYIGHGVRDTTVPYTSSVLLAEHVPTLEDIQLWDGTEHAETILQLMFGGTVQKKVLEWVCDESSDGSMVA